METVGRYQVLAELARGGLGVVYRARDPRSGEEVAHPERVAQDAVGVAEVLQRRRELDVVRSVPYASAMPGPKKMWKRELSASEN